MSPFRSTFFWKCIRPGRRRPPKRERFGPKRMVWKYLRNTTQCGTDVSVRVRRGPQEGGALARGRRPRKRGPPSQEGAPPQEGCALARGGRPRKRGAGRSSCVCLTVRQRCLTVRQTQSSRIGWKNSGELARTRRNPSLNPSLNPSPAGDALALSCTPLHHRARPFQRCHFINIGQYIQ